MTVWPKRFAGSGDSALACGRETAAESARVRRRASERLLGRPAIAVGNPGLAHQLEVLVSLAGEQDRVTRPGERDRDSHRLPAVEDHAVTIGVAAMPTMGEAETVREAQDLVASEWFAGLAGEEGTPAERLGYAGGHGISGHWGRYVLFSLATNSDGTPEDGEEEGSENDADGATELRDIGEGFFDQLHGTLSEERA